ncbi:MAG: chemotaxis protein CheW [bacterium]
MTNNDPEIFKIFIEESKEHLDVLEPGLLALEKEPTNPDPELINSIFRAVHSIKGAAVFFNLGNISYISHKMENVLGLIREGALKVNQMIIDALLHGTDKLNVMIETIETSEEVDITDELKNLDMILGSAVNINKKNTKVARKKRERKQQELPEEAKNPLLENIHKDKGNTADETLRVKVSLLNDLMNMVGEMVLGRNQLMRMTTDIVHDIHGLAAVLQHFNIITSALQEKIIAARMQPVNVVFSKFPRVVRDLAHKLGKSIELKISGKEVELDKSMIENLSDPLTHLIRNCVDHGIEPSQDRSISGKAPTGHIQLAAYHEGGQVNIDIIDDGRGIDPEIIKQKALDKGMISKKELARLNEKQVLGLIFMPGFSTAQSISEVSGRGVGMDVVRTNIEKLGGTISVESKIGEGTRINLKLPLTLAIIPSLIVSVQDQHFALPQISLVELVRLKPDDVSKKVETVQNSPVLRLRDKLLPLVRLSEVVGIDRYYVNPEMGEKETERRKRIADRRGSETCPVIEALPPVERRRHKTDRRNIFKNITRILVLNCNENYFGLIVDQINNNEEIVVKPLPRFLKGLSCYSGTTILGDGRIALILDINGIASKAQLKFDAVEKKNKDLADDRNNEIMREAQSLLLFENAPGECFGLNLDLIQRVEKVPMTSIERIGEREFLTNDNKSLRLLRLEKYLPVTTPSRDDEKVCVIIPKMVNVSVGIVAARILDTIHTDVEIDTHTICSKGIIGTAVINNRIVILPDIYLIIEMDNHQ